MKCSDCGADIPSNLAACPECLKPIPPIQPKPLSPDANNENGGRSLGVSRLSNALSVMFYIGIITVFICEAIFNPGKNNTGVKAFGPRPLGLPNLCFLLLLSTILYLPFPLRVFPAFTRLTLEASKDGRSLRPISLLLYAWEVGTLHPELAESSMWFFFGLIYTLVLFGSWTIYAAWNGF